MKVKQLSNYELNNSHMYTQKIRKYQNNNNIELWRNMMKPLEDNKEHRVVYDRIGKGSKSLV